MKVNTELKKSPTKRFRRTVKRSPTKAERRSQDDSEHSSKRSRSGHSGDPEQSAADSDCSVTSDRTGDSHSSTQPKAGRHTVDYWIGTNKNKQNQNSKRANSFDAAAASQWKDPLKTVNAFYEAFSTAKGGHPGHSSH